LIFPVVARKIKRYFGNLWLLYCPMEDLLKSVDAYCAEHKLCAPGDEIVVGVSGGADSVVLLDVLRRLGVKPIVAHVNYQLRGAESDGDADFVRELAAKWNLPFYLKTADTARLAKDQGRSIQDVARQIRYDFFEEVRRLTGADRIAVAHHRDDVAETVLFRLVRGTGIEGLRGMQPLHGHIIRPLLFVARDELLAYARARKLTWREDSSNASTKYARNFIRHKVMPLLREVNPAAVDNIIRNTLIFREIEAMVKSEVSEFKARHVQADAGQVSIDLAALRATTAPVTLLHYLLGEYGFSPAQVRDILAPHESGKVFLSANKRAVIHGDRLLVTDLAGGTSPSYMLEKWGQTELQTPDFKLSWEIKTYGGEEVPRERDTVWLDAGAMIFPLTLRKRQAGDWFCPLGMGGHRKKVKDYLTDLKLSLPGREKVWVLETAERKICWVVGYRPDERFKVHGGTTSVLILKKTPREEPA